MLEIIGKTQRKAENRFWQQVRNRKFYGLKIKRQIPIKYKILPGIDKYFIVDFYCNQYKLIIEIDGDSHLNKMEYDGNRSDLLMTMGFKVIRISNEDVLRNWPSVEEQIKNIIGI